MAEVPDDATIAIEKAVLEAASAAHGLNGVSMYDTVAKWCRIEGRHTKDMSGHVAVMVIHPDRDIAQRAFIAAVREFPVGVTKT